MIGVRRKGGASYPPQMRGNTALATLLDAAKGVARRRHHAVVRAAHIIDVLFASPGMDRRIRRNGIDADHLREAVAATLDAMPPVAGYRDVPIPDLCPSIVQGVRRVAPWLEHYGMVEILTALEDAPELRGAFRPYVLDESLVEQLRREAPGSDIADAMTWLLANHLDLAERLVDGGLDTDDLTTRCGRSYRDVAAEAVDAARSAGLRSVDATLLIAFFTREIAYAAGNELSVIGQALDRLVHGEPESVYVDDSALAEVVLLDDPITPATTVQSILTAHFDMSDTEAQEIVAAVDARTEAVAARTAAGRARDLALQARRTARRDGYPLRVVVRPCLPK